MVLHNPPHKMTIRQITCHVFPGATTIGTLEEIGLVVTIFVVIERHINGVFVMQVCSDIVDKCRVRHTR